MCPWHPPTSPLGRDPADTSEPSTHVSDLSSLSGNDLFALARARRDEAFGSVVTYSPKVFIPLTMLCRDKCGYCTFAQPPARLDTPYLEPDDVLAIARQGAEMGCHEALFTLGEKPELRYPVARDWLKRHGYDSTVHYVAAMAQLVLDETGLLPHGNTGAMNRDELALLRTVTPSQGMMLESLRGDLDAHRGAPDKVPARRLETLEWAGELQIPYTTGILVGIGENRADRIEALEAIAASHQRHGHVQEVIVQNFLPKSGTAMHNAAREPEQWLDPALHFPIADRSDSDGYARDDAGSVWPERTMERAKVDDGAEFELTGTISSQWYVGTGADPESLIPGDPFATGAVKEVLDGVRAGQDVGFDEMLALFRARGREVAAVAQVADELRQEIVGDVVTWVANRNINYTNVCTFKCRFCGFSKGPLSLNLRGTPYLLELEDIADRTIEAAEAGATEVCLQGGIHPNFDGDYYIDVARAVHEAVPGMHIHGFTALEVTEGAKRNQEPLADYLTRLKEAGQKSLPGTAAEILHDDVRATLCPDKINTEEWLEAHRIAHSVGLGSNVTIMFGSIERPEHWVHHLLRTRALQEETGGFTEFVGLPFVHMASPIYLQKKARRGPTFREVVLMHAVARIAYRGRIDNIQGSWVKLGFDSISQLLRM
ncbi:MAG: 7,8-didemethyl-8-hydroxy-5-deazariboflavin synthase subunit CofH [Actinobacteria bacterium]|nr:7,8-didemethyl-8-hydroxy-5-deazariboflavin synthase subunit CofH [Actinomycetota bacterium]